MFYHQNYSCWLTVYHDKLLKLKNSHPNIYEEFENGCFLTQMNVKTIFKDLH